MHAGADTPAYSWIPTLPTLLTSHSLIPIHTIRDFCPDALRCVSTDDHLLAGEEMAKSAISTPAAASGTIPNVPELFMKVVAEMEKGVSFAMHHDMVIA